MFRLTIREQGTSRFLARIFEHDGNTVVLDFGDRFVIEDALRKVVEGGFVVPWGDAREAAAPGRSDLLRLLALHYAASGRLVELIEV